MTARIITPETVTEFQDSLLRLERSPHTIGRYMHDVKSYYAFLGGQEVTSETTCAYKQKLVDRKYAPSSINTILASLFAFFKFMEWPGCGTQRMVIQRDAFCPEEKELSLREYKAIVKAAPKGRDKLIVQTLCATGIRVSELQYFTVEAVRRREVVVICKRKIRRIMVPDDLGAQLEAYAKERKITSGPIFRGWKGKPLSRRRVWAVTKSAGHRAGVRESKVYPHNLRKLFARTFCAAGGDVVKLSDVLGHSSIETTRIYTRSSGAEHRRLVNALGLVPALEETPEKEKPPRSRRNRRGKKSRR